MRGFLEQITLMVFIFQPSALIVLLQINLQSLGFFLSLTVTVLSFRRKQKLRR